MKAIESQGVTIDNMKEAVQTFRQKSGSGQAGQASRVTPRSAEALYDALEKYGIDFTKNAEDGKREFIILLGHQYRLELMLILDILSSQLTP